MNAMVVVLVSFFKKYILRLLLIVLVFGGLYWYIDSSNKELAAAKQSAATLTATNKKLNDEVKDSKEQSKIDTQTVSTNQKAQGELEVVQAVAIEKVQNEVKHVLQGAPVGSLDSKSTSDAVSAAVVDGMWDSYNGSVHGGAVTSSTR